jgi:hypothetical protein
MMSSAVPFTRLRADSYVKDNRLLPRGFDMGLASDYWLEDAGPAHVWRDHPTEETGGVGGHRQRPRGGW